jgi:hypothetical protein
MSVIISWLIWRLIDYLQYFNEPEIVTEARSYLAFAYVKVNGLRSQVVCPSVSGSGLAYEWTLQVTFTAPFFSVRNTAPGGQ